MNESDEIDISDTKHAPNGGAQQSYSLYEPNYQQMHPLIYYEDPSHNHHLLGSAVSQLWTDQEHYVYTFGDSSGGTCSTVGMQMNGPHHHHHHHHHQSNAVHLDGTLIADIVESPGEHQDYNGAHTIERCRCREEEVDEDERQEENPERGELEEDEEECETEEVRAGQIARQQVADSIDNFNSNSTDFANQLVNIKTEQSDSSSQQTNKEIHNEIERRRRFRIKQCCDVLRNLVPGLSDKTDKATVLEHTVKYVKHLSACPNFTCECELA